MGIPTKGITEKWVKEKSTREVLEQNVARVLEKPLAFDVSAATDDASDVSAPIKIEGLSDEIPALDPTKVFAVKKDTSPVREEPPLPDGAHVVTQFGRTFVATKDQITVLDYMNDVAPKPLNVEPVYDPKPPGKRTLAEMAAGRARLEAHQRNNPPRPRPRDPNENSVVVQNPGDAVNKFGSRLG